MPDPSWPSSPPEANYLRLLGPGATGTATTLASAAAWQALLASHEVAVSASTLNTATTALNFEGLGGLGSTTAATELNTSLQLLAGWVQEKPPILASAVSAYEMAVSSMIPAEVSLANRAAQAADVAMNPLVLGALTPVIVALDAEYFGEHWPHNAGAGAAYGAALTALVPALAVPPPLAPPGASPAAPASAAAAVAETAGETAAGQVMKESSQVARLSTDAAAPAEGIGQAASTFIQPLQSAMQPLMGMFQAPMQAMQAMQGLASLPQSLMGQLGAVSVAPMAGEAAVPAAMLAAAVGPGVEAVGTGAGVGAGAGLSGVSSVGASGAGGVGGVPGAALTSYTRPTSSFAPENSGRPVGLKTGLLSAAEMRGPTTTAGGGPVPVSPARSGMLGQSKVGNAKDDAPVARIVIAADPGPEPRYS
jgi:hypothetical protein